jgi:hypothetical protein
MKTLFFFCLTLATCRLYSQDTSLFRHLPPEADAIYQFNLPVLTSKLGWQELADKIPLPQKNTSARELASILKEPFRAGVDPGRAIFWIEIETPIIDPQSLGATLANPQSPAPPFANSQSPGAPTASPRNPETPLTGPRGPHPRWADSLRTTSLLLHLADSARFAAFLREQEPGICFSLDKATTETAGSADAEVAGRSKFGVAWDKDLAVLTFVQSWRTAPPSPRTLAHYTSLAIHQSRSMLRGYDDFHRIRDPRFLTGFSDGADIHAWTAPGQLLSFVLQQFLHLDHSPIPNSNIHVLSALRFEKGRVTLKSTMPLPPGADSPYARLIARPLNTALLSRIPSSSPLHASTAPLLALLNLHFDPTAVGDLLDSLHARGRTEALLFDKGLSLETFVHAFQGDFLLTAVQPDSGRQQPALYAAIPLNDIPAFWQWMGRLKWLNVSADVSGPGRGNSHTQVGRNIPSWLIKDNLFVIGPTSSMHGPSIVTYRPRDTVFVANRIRDPAFIAQRMRESPLSLRIDFRAVADFLSHRDPTPSEKNRALLAILNHLDQFVFTAGRLNSDGQVENFLELDLADPSENSLRGLFRLLQ